MPPVTPLSRPERFVVLAEGRFGPVTSKTANALLRYTPERAVAVIDSTKAGRTVSEILGFGGNVPVVATLQEGMALGANALVIGIAPTGGQLPYEWRDVIRRAIRAHLDVWSGLHFHISDDPELGPLAEQLGVHLFDLRKPPSDLVVSTGLTRDIDATVVLTVGTDCNIGKMTTQLQLRDALVRGGERAVFAATGQTGILIEGWGIGVDAVVADFIGGAAERVTLDAASRGDIVLLEGQGSIVHPSFSGVTYGLIHGSMPHAFVMCAQPTRTAIRNVEWMKIPPLAELITLHERIAAPLRPAPVIAMTLNTFDLSEHEAREEIERAHAETGLPVTDPVRFDPAPVADAVAAFHRRRVESRRKPSGTRAQ